MTKAEIKSPIYEMANSHFPLFTGISSRLKNGGSLKDVPIAWHCHLTSLTAIAANALVDAGARLYLSECSPATSEDEAIKIMQDHGAKVYLGSKSTTEVLSQEPALLADTGLVLISAYINNNHSNKSTFKVSGASEITGSGITRLNKLSSLPVPVINLNDGILKSKIENFHGVGDGLIEALKEATGRSFAGEKAAVIGYGQVGSGAARYLQLNGVQVNVVESNPVRALTAHYDGFGLMNIEAAISSCKLIISATGAKNLFDQKLWLKAKNGLIAVNLGHWQEELNLEALGKVSQHREKINKNMSLFQLKDSGHKIYVLTDGAPANVAMLTGSIEPTLIHLATELLTMEYLVNTGESLENKEYKLPLSIEAEVSQLALEALGLNL